MDETVAPWSVNLSFLWSYSSAASNFRDSFVRTTVQDCVPKYVEDVN